MPEGGVTHIGLVNILDEVPFHLVIMFKGNVNGDLGMVLWISQGRGFDQEAAISTSKDGKTFP